MMKYSSPGSTGRRETNQKTVNKSVGISLERLTQRSATMVSDLEMELVKIEMSSKFNSLECETFLDIHFEVKAIRVKIPIFKRSLSSTIVINKLIELHNQNLDFNSKFIFSLKTYNLSTKEISQLGQAEKAIIGFEKNSIQRIVIFNNQHKQVAILYVNLHKVHCQPLDSGSSVIQRAEKLKKRCTTDHQEETRSSKAPNSNVSRGTTGNSIAPPQLQDDSKHNTSGYKSHSSSQQQSGNFESKSPNRVAQGQNPNALGNSAKIPKATKHKNNVNSNPVHITVTAQVPQIHGRSQWIGHQHSKSQKTPQMSFSPESVEKDKNIQKESDEFFMVDIPHYFEQDQSVENTPRLTKEDEYLSAADYYSTLEELKNEKKIYKKQLEELQWYEKKFDEAEYHLESRKKYYQEAKNGIQNARNQRNKRFSLFPSD